MKHLIVTRIPTEGIRRSSTNNRIKSIPRRCDKVSFNSSAGKSERFARRLEIMFSPSCSKKAKVRQIVPKDIELFSVNSSIGSLAIHSKTIENDEAEKIKFRANKSIQIKHRIFQKNSEKSAKLLKNIEFRPKNRNYPIFGTPNSHMVHNKFNQIPIRRFFDIKYQSNAQRSLLTAYLNRVLQKSTPSP